MLRDYCLILLSWLYIVNGKQGYFWHVSDIHYDPTYYYASQRDNGKASCWNTRVNKDNRLHDKLPKAGIYGHYDCDSSWALIESAANAMKMYHRDSEFLLWTGDALAHPEDMSKEDRTSHMKNLTNLLARTFTDIIPVLGHTDIGLNFSQIADLWRSWLPEEALATFGQHGYYTMELRSKKYQIIALNTNLWMNMSNSMKGGSIIDNRVRTYRSTGYQRIYDSDPAGQWAWFRKTLDVARSKSKNIYIVGHTPPGIDDRIVGGYGGLSIEHNFRYLAIVREYADMIKGQFFGHLHSDTFRVIYSDTGQPVSWVMVAPSITPYRSGGPNNPGIRAYKFDDYSGKILDYAQYYLDLPEANFRKDAKWRLEYTMKDHYDVNEITAFTLHDLATRLTQTNERAFARYYLANRVKPPREVEELWGCSSLIGLCALQHYCAITRMDAQSYKDCKSSQAFAYSSSRASRKNLTNFAIPLLIQLIVRLFVNFLGTR